jgi:hypothetical protein
MPWSDDEIVLAASCVAAHHAQDLEDPPIGAPQVAQRLPARRPEVVCELVVLHERAVDDRHAEVDVEQDGDRLELADDDVREHAQEREKPFGVRAPAHHFADGALPFFAQPLDHGLRRHARHAHGMQRDEQPHAAAAEPTVDGGPLARRDGEGDGLRIAIEEVDVARATGERPRRADPVADVLDAGGCVAGHDKTRLAVVETERGDPVVLAVEDPGLTVRGRRREPGEPAAEAEALLGDQPCERRTVSQLERASQVRVGEGVDLEYNQATSSVTRTALAAEHAVLQAVPPLDHARAARRPAR